MRLQEHLEVLNEGLSPDIKNIADNFARFLIGDRKQALSGLEKLKKATVALPKDMSSGDYNTIYKDLYGGILLSIKKVVEKYQK